MIRHARMRGRPALFLPGLDHASIAAQFVLDRIIAERGREPAKSSAASVYLERMRAVHRTRRATVMLGQQRRVGASLDWGRLRFTMDEGSATCRPCGVHRAPQRGPRVPHRGAGQLVPGLPDERQRPRGDPDTGERHALVDPLPPDRRGDGRARPRRDDHGRHDPARDDPRRHRRRGPSGRRPLPRSRRAGGSGSRSSSATSRSSPTRSSSARSGPVRSRSRRPTTTTTTQTGRRHGLPMPTILDDAAAISGTGTPYDGLDRYEAREANPGRPRGARRPRR